MSKFKIAVFLIVALFALTACTSKPTTTETAVATDEPTVEAVVSAVPDSTECLNCHTDKQRLIDTAAPVAEAESESKGVG